MSQYTHKWRSLDSHSDECLSSPRLSTHANTHACPSVTPATLLTPRCLTHPLPTTRDHRAHSASWGISLCFALPLTLRLREGNHGSAASHKQSESDHSNEISHMCHSDQRKKQSCNEHGLVQNHAGAPTTAKQRATRHADMLLPTLCTEMHHMRPNKCVVTNKRNKARPCLPAYVLHIAIVTPPLALPHPTSYNMAHTRFRTQNVPHITVKV